MTRAEIQKQSLSLSQKYNILALEWATGVGKSKVALDICNSVITKENKILIVVAELAHIKNWHDEFQKWKYKDILENNVTIVTYASLKKHKNKVYNYIILDEAHHIGSDIRMDILESLQFDKLILLSATLNEVLIDNITFLFKEPVHRFVITLQNAIEWRILKEPEIILIPLKLNLLHPNQTIIEERGKKSLRVTYKCTYRERWNYLKDKKKYANMRLEISCTEREKYDYLTSKINAYKRIYFTTKNEAIKNKWLQLGSERKRYLGELKTTIVKNFIKTKLNKKRILCFCSSIEQADILGGINAIHSQKNDSLDIINNFNDEKINSLYAVGMLQEG